MTQVGAEEAAHRILRQVERATAEQDTPERDALEWFAGPEAARAVDEVLGAVALPDGSAWRLGVLALGYADLFRYAARGPADRGAIAGAVLRFGALHEEDPGQVPPVLHPLYATLAGAPEGTGTPPLLAYDAAVGMTIVFQQSRDPGVLRMAEILLRHAVATVGEGSAEQGVCLSDLGLVLFHGFQDGAGLPALSEAVAVGRAAVACAPGVPDEQARRHGNFGHTLRNWAEAAEDPGALREAVTALRTAVELATDADPAAPSTAPPSVPRSASPPSIWRSPRCAPRASPCCGRHSRIRTPSCPAAPRSSPTWGSPSSRKPVRRGMAPDSSRRRSPPAALPPTWPRTTSSAPRTSPTSAC